MQWQGRKPRVVAKKKFNKILRRGGYVWDQLFSFGSTLTSIINFLTRGFDDLTSTFYVVAKISSISDQGVS